jgi:hypothetical protein
VLFLKAAAGKKPPDQTSGITRAHTAHPTKSGFGEAGNRLQIEFDHPGEIEFSCLSASSIVANYHESIVGGGGNDEVRFAINTLSCL